MLHVSDSLQVQCIQSYSSQEPDELSIEMADVLNLLERTDDGGLYPPFDLVSCRKINSIFCLCFFFSYLCHLLRHHRCFWYFRMDVG